MYILWSSDVHQKWEKRAGNWAKMVRLDKMSRRDWGREWRKSMRLDIMSKLEREYSEKTLFLLLDLSPTDTVFVLHY